MVGYVNIWKSNSITFIIAMHTEIPEIHFEKRKWITFISLLAKYFCIPLKVSSMLVYRDPQPPGCRPVLVRGPLGTRLLSRRGVACEWAKLHLPLPIARITAWTIHHHPTPPPTIPTPSMEKLSDTNPVPGAKKIGDCCLYTLYIS